MKRRSRTIWIVVRVVRGLIEDAAVFATRAKALTRMRRWQATLNPDYGEMEIFPRTARSR